MAQNPQNIKAAFIIEMLGRPADHVKLTMEQLVDRFGNEKGTKIVQKTIHDPVEYNLEEENDKERNNKISVKQKLFTTFAEIEAEFESVEPLLMAAFNYMPSNIEIISPENFILKNHDISGILTGIVVRLHRYDEVTKKLVVDREMLENQLRSVLEQTGLSSNKLLENEPFKKRFPKDEDENKPLEGFRKGSEKEPSLKAQGTEPNGSKVPKDEDDSSKKIGKKKKNQ
ncbi:MAG: hypothetical protein AABW91_02595 [Nanoarchaeota archaeon]